MRIKPKWIVFDVGGVLFNGNRAFSKIAEYLEIDIQQINQQIERFSGEPEKGSSTFADIWLSLMKKFNKAKDLNEITRLWWDDASWLPDSIKLTHELRQNHYHLAILTNNWKGMGPKLRRAVFLEPFEYIFESSTLKMRKPDLEIYQSVEAKLNTHGPEIFYIDDSTKNIETAEKLGWQVFHYRLGDDQGISTNNQLRKILTVRSGVGETHSVD